MCANIKEIAQLLKTSYINLLFKGSYLIFIP